MCVCVCVCVCVLCVLCVCVCGWGGVSDKKNNTTQHPQRRQKRTTSLIKKTPPSARKKYLPTSWRSFFVLFDISKGSISRRNALSHKTRQRATCATRTTKRKSDKRKTANSSSQKFVPKNACTGCTACLLKRGACTSVAASTPSPACTVSL